MKVKVLIVALVLMITGCMKETNLLPKFSATPIMESTYGVNFLQGFATQQDREGTLVLSSVYSGPDGLHTVQKTTTDTTLADMVLREYLSFEAQRGKAHVVSLLYGRKTDARAQVEEMVGQPLGDFLLSRGMGLDKVTLEIPTPSRDSANTTVYTEVPFVKGVGDLNGRQIKMYSLGAPSWEMAVDSTIIPLVLVNGVFTNPAGNLQIKIK